MDDQLQCSVFTSQGEGGLSCRALPVWSSANRAGLGALNALDA